MFGKKETTNESKSTLKRYYLEVIGGTKEEQKYLVKANDMTVTSNGCYVFEDEQGEVIAMYPISRTILRSIEVL